MEKIGNTALHYPGFHTTWLWCTPSPQTSSFSSSKKNPRTATAAMMNVENCTSDQTLSISRQHPSPSSQNVWPSGAWRHLWTVPKCESRVIRPNRAVETHFKIPRFFRFF